jgi:hypothetical protein
MVDIRPVQDIFGLGRLAQSIRQNRFDEEARKQADQQAETAGLQQQSLRLGIQEKQGTLADLAGQRKVSADMQTAISQDNGKSKTLQAIEFLKTRDPEKAQALINSTMENAGKLAKFNAQGALDFVNQELGQNWKLEKEDVETMTVDMGDKTALINKSTGDVIKDIPKTQVLTPQQKAFSTLSLEQQAQTFQKGKRVIRSLPDGGFEVIEGDVGGGSGETKGRTAADKAFGAEFVDWRYKGGAADVAKNLDQLDMVIDELKSGKNLTGSLLGLLPQKIKAMTNPDAVNAQELIEEVVQRNLRLILGAQFTQKEGERLIARAYNPQLSEELNAVRVGRLFSQVRRAAEAKEAASKYFEENGSLTGFKGKIPTFSDFMQIDFSDSGNKIPSGLPPGTSFLGTKNGKNVYQLPDGSKVMDNGEGN